MGVILSEAKNLACEGQMFRLRLNMTTLQNTRDEAIVVIEGIVKWQEKSDYHSLAKQ